MRDNFFVWLAKGFIINSIVSTLGFWFGNSVDNIIVFLDYDLFSSLQLWYDLRKKELSSFLFLVIFYKKIVAFKIFVERENLEIL